MHMYLESVSWQTKVYAWVFPFMIAAQVELNNDDLKQNISQYAQ